MYIWLFNGLAFEPYSESADKKEEKWYWNIF